MPHTHRPVSGVLLLALVALLLAACTSSTAQEPAPSPTTPPTPPTVPEPTPPNVPDGSTLPRHTPLPSETQAPGEIEIVLYWAVGEDLQPEHRRIPATQAVGTAALELLLAGPQQPGLSTAIPTPEEVQSYPGRQPDWGERVRLLGLTIEDGVATANFSQEMRAYGGGSARVHMIREQITQTLLQFPTVQEVRIAVEGEVETALQP